MLVEEMNIALAVYNLGQLQDLLQLKKTLENLGLTWEEFKDYIEYRKEEHKRTGRSVTFITKPCPKCHGVMDIKSGDDGDSQWVCRNCRFGIYSPESVGETIRLFVKEKQDGIR